MMSNPYDFSQAPNIAGAGNYAQMLQGLFRPPQQQRGQQTRGGTPTNPALPGAGPAGIPGAPQQPAFGFIPRNPDGSVNWAGWLNPLMRGNDNPT